MTKKKENPIEVANKLSGEEIKVIRDIGLGESLSVNTQQILRELARRESFFSGVARSI